MYALLSALEHLCLKGIRAELLFQDTEQRSFMKI